jgi:hypothetical protein
MSSRHVGDTLATFPAKEDCNFTPLPYLVLITQIVIPIGIGIGIPAVFLIPNVYQTENLIHWANEGWYSEIIDRSVVSGLLTTVRCDDDDDDDDGDDDDDSSSSDVSDSEESAITERRIV